MSTGKIVLIIVGVLVVLVGGLAALAIPTFQRIQKMAQEMKSAGQAKKHEPPPPLTVPQQAALEQFGGELVDALNEKNAAKVTAMQDDVEFCDRVFGQLPSGFPNQTEIRRGFMQGIKKREGGWLWSAMSGESHFLRTRERQGYPALVLRIKSEEGAVSYVDILVRPHGEEFRVVDMFTYIFATTASEESRNVLTTMLSSPAGGGLASLLGSSQLDRKSAEILIKINEASQAGNAAEVLRICDGLPPELKARRSFFIIRLQALMTLGAQGDKTDEAYKAALRAAPEILGKDSATELLMVDLLFMEKDYKGVDECVKRLDSIIGGDGYLKFLRGNAHLMMKDYDKALELAAQALREDPSLTEVFDLRLAVHLARKDYKAVVAELRTLKRDYDRLLDRKILADDPQYTEFLASPEFAEWEKELAKP